MVNRGILFLRGLGVPENKSQAYIHFSRATAYANDPALRNGAIKLRDGTAKPLSAQDLNAAQAEAKKLASAIDMSLPIR